MSTIQLKRGTTSSWTSQNPVLADGQPGVEITSSGTRLKIGDGTTAWNDLEYLTIDASDITTGNVSIVRGGTGQPYTPALLVNLSSEDPVNPYTTSPRPGVTGTLSISHGGTGATSASAARTALGITPANIGAAASSHNHSATNITSGTLPVSRGGTGSTSFTASRAIVSNSRGNLTVSAVTSTELGYLDGVTSSIQTQLNNKLSLAGGTITGNLTIGNTLTTAQRSAPTNLSITAGSEAPSGYDNGQINITGSSITLESNVSGNYVTVNSDLQAMTKIVGNLTTLTLQAGTTQGARSTQLVLSEDSTGGSSQYWAAGGIYHSSSITTTNRIPTAGNVEDYVSQQLTATSTRVRVTPLTSVNSSNNLTFYIYKIGNLVSITLNGSMDFGSNTSAQTVTTLASSYRPQITAVVEVPAFSGPAIYGGWRVRFGTDGTVQIISSQGGMRELMTTITYATAT